jgi:hypothetical protein
VFTVFARVKLAGVRDPTVAVTVYPPVVALAVNNCEVAMPLALVVSVSVAAGGVVANVQVAADAGAANVTDMPLTGFELLSTTVATKGFANCVFTSAPCPLPLVAVTVAGAPAVFVRLKLAGVVAPEVVAVTV